jgi:hypothetical protein
MQAVARKKRNAGRPANQSGSPPLPAAAGRDDRRTTARDEGAAAQRRIYAGDAAPEWPAVWQAGRDSPGRPSPQLALTSLLPVRPVLEPQLQPLEARPCPRARRCVCWLPVASAAATAATEHPAARPDVALSLLSRRAVLDRPHSCGAATTTSSGRRRFNATSGSKRAGA